MLAFMKLLFEGIFSQKFPKKLMTFINRYQNEEELPEIKNPSLMMIKIFPVKRINVPEQKEVTKPLLQNPILRFIKVGCKILLEHFQTENDSIQITNPILKFIKIGSKIETTVNTVEPDSTQITNPVIKFIKIDHSWWKLRRIEEIHSTQIINPTLNFIKIGDMQQEYGIQ